MRNLPLARRQLFSGLLLLALAWGIGQFVLLPQFKTYQKIQTMEKTYPQDSSTPMGLLPVVSSDGNTSLWQDNVVAPLYRLSTETKTMILNIQGTPALAEEVNDLPPAIKKVPITITIYGSYPSLQGFIDKLIQQLPASAVRSIKLKNADSASIPPEESPILEGIITLDLYVHQVKM